MKVIIIGLVILAARRIINEIGDYANDINPYSERPDD